jgi:hypothetical protein
MQNCTYVKIAWKKIPSGTRDHIRAHGAGNHFQIGGGGLTIAFFGWAFALQLLPATYALSVSLKLKVSLSWCTHLRWHKH